MYQPKTIYTELALETILHFVRKEKLEVLKNKTVPDELKIHAGCFVSLHMLDGALRGCIGTIEPKMEKLYFEIIENAVSACSRDPRFPPVSEQELDELVISVDVLSKPEEIGSIDELDPKKYGVIVSDGFLSRAVLLPDLETIDTVDRQLQVVKKKAGLSTMDNESLMIKRFTSSRYE